MRRNGVSMNPAPIGFAALEGTYAESGKPEELFEKFGLTAKHIFQAAQKAISRKIT